MPAIQVFAQKQKLTNLKILQEKTVRTLLQKIVAVTIPGVQKEIIIVDDGSTDASPVLITSFLAKLRRKTITFIKHKKNRGKGAAVKTALKKAKGEYVVIQDADLEYNPAQIKRLVLPVLRGESQVVYGTRLDRMPNFSRDEKTPLFLLHYLGNRFLSLVTSILYLQWVTDMETCYKLFPKNALNKIRLNAKRFDFEPEITAKLLKKGYKILEVPITTTPRGYKEGRKLYAFKDGPKALWTLLRYRIGN